MVKPCSNTELIARVVALEANLAALRQVLDERDDRYKQRALSQDAAVKSALDTSEKAITKAEGATERRFEGVNEFRQTLADQAATLMPRAEYTVQHKAVVDKVDNLEKRMNETTGRGGGIKEAWGYVIAIASLLLTALVVYTRH